MGQIIDFTKLSTVPDATSISPSTDRVLVLSQTAPGQRQVRKIDPGLLGGGAAVLSRADHVISVSSGQSLGIMPIGKTTMLLYFSASQPCRFRSYFSASARNADTARPTSTFPNSNSGLMFEFIAVGGLMAAPLSPGILSFNSEQPVTNQQYYTVNSDTSVIITLTYIVLE